MVQVLDELGLTRLATSIPGLSAVGAAAILAETGDPTRFSSARALVKHAGLCPRDNASGAYQGKTGISGRGRPQLRLAAWRAVWAALRNNPVLAARYAHLTGRADNKLTKTQARVAVAGSLLRQLHAVITTGTAWDPAIAGGLEPQPVKREGGRRCRLTPRVVATGRGEPARASGSHPAKDHGQPRPSPAKPG